MNWLDIVILCFLGIGLIKGLYDGVIKQIVALVALVIGIYLCSSVAKWLCIYLLQFAWFPQGAILFTSYFLGFVIIVIIILLAGNIVHRLVDATPLSIFNHVIGGFIGFILTVIIISVLLNIIEMVDNQSVLLPQQIKVESHYYYVIKKIISTIFPGNLFELQKVLFE